MCIVSDSSFPTCYTSISTRQDQSGTTQQHKMAYFGTIQVLGQDHYLSKGVGSLRVQVKTQIFRFLSCWIDKLHLKKLYMIRCWSHGNSAAKCQSFVWDNFNFLILKLAHDRLNLLLLLAGWQSGAGQRLLCGVLFQSWEPTMPTVP